MRPRVEVESILTYNSLSEEGDWVPTRVGVNSWIMLQPSVHGGHAKDAKKHSHEGGYKARIVKFRSEKGIVKGVLIQHVYMRRQLNLEHGVQHGACNYLYLSTFEDWQDPKSIMDVLYVIHADIGDPQRGSETHKDLLKIGVYFYNAMYFPRETPTGYGQLEDIPLPSFESPEWSLPDIATSESFRARLRSDFRASMKPNVGSRGTHIQWFIPTHVMVDLFSNATMHRTPTLFVFKNLTKECFDLVMDEGWDLKICVGLDIIKCSVDWSTIIFQYHIGRSTLYANFQYDRERLICDSDWESLEQV